LTFDLEGGEVKGQYPQKAPLDTKGSLSTKFGDNRSKGLARSARTDGQTNLVKPLLR